MSPKSPTDEDKELDPKILRFGMSKADVDKIKNEAKRKKKPAKKWRPEGH